VRLSARTVAGEGAAKGETKGATPNVAQAATPIVVQAAVEGAANGAVQNAETSQWRSTAEASQRGKTAEAFDLARWMEAYGDTVLRTAYFYLRDRQKAEDVYQDVFLKVYRNRGKLDGMSSPKAWVLKVTINACRDLARTPWWRKVLLLAGPQEEHIRQDGAGKSESAENEALLTESYREIYESVLTLEEPYRSVVLLYYYHELSTPDIGRILHIAEGTVRSRLHRAREMLRAHLDDKEGRYASGK